MKMFVILSYFTGVRNLDAHEKYGGFTLNFFFLISTNNNLEEPCIKFSSFIHFFYYH